MFESVPFPSAVQSFPLGAAVLWSASSEGNVEGRRTTYYVACTLVSVVKMMTYRTAFLLRNHHLQKWVSDFTGVRTSIRHRTVCSIYCNTLTEFDYLVLYVVQKDWGPILVGLWVWDTYVDRKFYGLVVELYRCNVSLCVGRLYRTRWKGHCLSTVFIWWHFLPPSSPACDLSPPYFRWPHSFLRAMRRRWGLEK